jgi:transposase
MCGVKTNVVTAVEIHGRHTADITQLPKLLKKTGRNFKLGEVSADKAYLSYENAREIARAGATPFIAFKTNSSVGFSAGHRRNWTNAWAEMFHYFQFKREEFLRHYHRRSNVESTFSMMKRKFGDSIRSKTQVAAVNEVLCKVLCHNIVVLIHESFELGLEPIFWAKSEPAQQEGGPSN